MEAKLIDGSLHVLCYVLIPMDNDKFMIENGGEQVLFVKDAAGNYSELVVRFRDGSRASFERLND